MAARVPYVEREELDAEGQEIYDRIRKDRNAPRVGLQFRALLHSPRATSHLTSMGAQLRFQSALPENLKEFAIIIVAREWNSDIEWTAHSALAAKAGVSAEALEAVRTGKAPAGLDEKQRTIVAFIHGLLRKKDVPDETFNAVQKMLGTKLLRGNVYGHRCRRQTGLHPRTRLFAGLTKHPFADR